MTIGPTERTLTPGHAAGVFVLGRGKASVGVGIAPAMRAKRGQNDSGANCLSASNASPQSNSEPTVVNPFAPKAGLATAIGVVGSRFEFSTARRAAQQLLTLNGPKVGICDPRHIWSGLIPFQSVVVLSAGGTINAASFSRFDTLDSGFEYDSGLDAAAYGYCCLRYGFYCLAWNRCRGACAHETNIGCPKKLARDQIGSFQVANFSRSP